MNSTGGKSSGPLFLFVFNDCHISRISSSVKLIVSRTVLELGSGGSENVRDSMYTKTKKFENSSAFNGSVSAVSFLYLSKLGELDL